MVPAVDLFAGAGGLSLGAESAGASVRLLVDLDPVACQTLRENPKHHKGKVLEEDIAELDGAQLRALAGLSRRDPLLIIGGAPCQPFSKASYWTDPGDEARYRRARARGEKARRPTQTIKARPDRRRSLVREFWRLVDESRADAFVFENVPSILHPRNQGEFKRLLRAADTAGFGVTVVRANAVEFGVPQRRVRVFVLGLRGEPPLPPAPTHSEGNGTHSGTFPAVTAGEALVAFADKLFFEPEEVVQGRWAKHLETVPPGGNYKAHTAWAGHPRPTFETETRFWNFLLKLSPKLPSWTIAANPGPWIGPFHWDSRRLRTPEFAALQGFPPGYAFTGGRRDRVRQIGNAVPPPLAQPMIESVIAAMCGRTARQTRRRRVTLCDA
jgi:DNA (cytosine-5)-methyltransferase 1